MLEWNETLDTQLREHIKSYTVTGAARRMNIKPEAAWRRTKKLGVAPVSVREQYTPSQQEWLNAAAKQTRQRRLKLSDVLAGERKRPHVIARILAWKELLENKKYSIAGVARISGFDHTTILHGMKRLSVLLAWEEEKAIKELQHIKEIRLPQ